LSEFPFFGFNGAYVLYVHMEGWDGLHMVIRLCGGTVESGRGGVTEELLTLYLFDTVSTLCDLGFAKQYPPLY
jgi:hypothetical protein